MDMVDEFERMPRCKGTKVSSSFESSIFSRFSSGRDSSLIWLREYEKFNSYLGLFDAADDVLNLLLGVSLMEKKNGTQRRFLDTCQLEQFFSVYRHFESLVKWERQRFLYCLLLLMDK
jgi:hypothetical protein